ncbi:retrovirus-related Pol polyprotein from transposon 297 [Trichonephila clavipes]|nr:retrovirus-related Pol polyprotein from transposon 297 [Trichonephila clavipes]
MRELAKIDEASIIQYVINGIDGPRSYKIILYGATSLSEFKQKLRTYETVIKNMGIHNSNSPNFRHSYESRGRDFKQQSFQRRPAKFNASDAARNPQRRFNCNDIGHLSKSCPNHSRGPRCLSCNIYGHKSFECRRANLNNTSAPPSGVNAVHELPSPIKYLKNGFFHVAVNERSRKFTSFVTHNGQYQFRRMPFGLSTCTSTFMRYINAIFRHLILKSIVLPYMDDVVIPSDNESQALEYLKIVLQVACDYGLEINFKKCQFLHNKIEFLGHTIENGRLFLSPSKTKAVINYPDIKNIKKTFADF